MKKGVPFEGPKGPYHHVTYFAPEVGEGHPALLAVEAAWVPSYIATVDYARAAWRHLGGEFWLVEYTPETDAFDLVGLEELDAGGLPISIAWRRLSRAEVEALLGKDPEKVGA